MGERKLARVVRIDDIRTHDNADALELAYIGGWQVVIKKGEFQIGDLAVYLEIDSWVPHDLAPFLSKGAVPRTYNDIPGERLKTVKLRGEVSQGLLLSADEIAGVPLAEIEEDTDVTEALGIQKWEKPVSAELGGQVKGSFPLDICPKTDAERIQNCWKKVSQDPHVPWVMTEKLDGSSMTVILGELDEVRVASRNQELKINDENKDNTFVKLALETRKKVNLATHIAFQGELIGPGIQGNSYKLKTHKFMVFGGWNLSTKKPIDWWNLSLICKEFGLDMVPMLGSTTMNDWESARDLLAYADGRSKLADVAREGIVFRHVDGHNLRIFKAISNKWLIKNDG